MTKRVVAYIFLFIVLATGCQQQVEKNEVGKVTFPARAASWNIYEVNIRQYTPEGTINAFSEHLPRLKELGIDLLWIMPVQPIGQKNRKGPLGSYYSIQNYSET